MLATIDAPVNAVNVPAAAELAPITVPSIAPASTSTLLISTSPVPFGVIAIFPFDPSVMVIEPVVELPVCKVTSWFPSDEKIPAPLPVPVFAVPLTFKIIVPDSFGTVIVRSALGSVTDRVVS